MEVPRGEAVVRKNPYGTGFKDMEVPRGEAVVRSRSKI
jgi:hypothetical protein